MRFMMFLRRVMQAPRSASFFPAFLRYMGLSLFLCFGKTKSIALFHK